MRVYELSAYHDARQSFYGKAQVIEQDDGQTILQSYSTKVARIWTDDDGEDHAEVYGTYSQTTLRHIKEFLLGFGFEAKNSKQIMADYGVSK